MPDATCVWCCQSRRIQVFAIPGLGRLVLGAIAKRNYPLVQATILVMTLAFQDPFQQVMVRRMQPPGTLNLLGTDHLGRDVLARIVYGYRSSLLTCTLAVLLALLAVLLALLAGGSLGRLSAYYRGWFERIIMRIMDVFFAFPIMLLAIGVIAILGPGIRGGRDCRGA